eukprot:TRINITY_DN16917_c0_g1_i5.p1 TRINITY_DN16917_c0_g1~~TRINITY_DN16917_c0_g1_i5.p1  ORF type:complete len:118 (-),score=15.01 TRINITY_DN16917_c0_g1_i5:139-492(-)
MVLVPAGNDSAKQLELMGRPAPIGPASRGLEAQTAFLNPGWLNKVFEVNASEVGFSSATTATALPMYLPRGEVPGVGDAAAADPFWPPMPASPDEEHTMWNCLMTTLSMLDEGLATR